MREKSVQSKASGPSAIKNDLCMGTLLGDAGGSLQFELGDDGALVMHQQFAISPAMRRIGGSYTNRNYAKGRSMIALITGIVTSIATTIAAFFMWRDWKLKTTPYIAVERMTIEQNAEVLTIRMHPADAAVRFKAIEAKGACLAFVDTGEYSIETGVKQWKPAHDLVPDRLPVDISLPPARVSGREHELHVWINLANSARSLRICMIARHKYFDVRYWLTM
ncbi:MAG: hypothetical protein AB7E12_14815 [Burkholderiaceae bacterium]